MSVFKQGSTALITGGSSGIGYAVAQLCLKHGMRVAIVDINTQNLELAKKNLSSSGDLETYAADVSKEEDWQVLKEKVKSKYGDDAPDFLMLNAGIGARGSWGDGDYFKKVCILSVHLQVYSLGADVSCLG
jgi:NAD(P)-dependent dehydrogenase (short-subunit alcohol dehydrogenase family)